ncbi:dynein axonemal intermediate chain 4 isoform X3 [Denticeps clupeoides]|uniref:dynein axonemal intermediate chain 4 isoform X3 n=1 Tax=Denticeps clupeoides TaxID=299321 RepID=UPI0010A369A5|nr:WD repeat-containing protein 78 isoform X3 [Denticeps clupeoides]
MSYTAAKTRKTTLRAPAGGAGGVMTSGVLRVNRSTTTKTRSVYASASRKSFSLAADSKVLLKSSTQAAKHAVQVLDETGKDVAPRPLYQPDPGTAAPKQGKIFTPNDTTGGNVSDFFTTGFLTSNASFGDLFTRSILGSSVFSRSIAESDEIEDASSKRDRFMCITDVRVRKDDVKEPMRKDMLDQVVRLYLTETETLWLLDVPPNFVSVDSEEAETVRERNRAYQELCKNRPGNDKYTDRAMQTLSGAPKTKEVQSERVGMVDAGDGTIARPPINNGSPAFTMALTFITATMATTWDIYDSSCNSVGAGEAAPTPSATKSDLEKVESPRAAEGGGSPASAASHSTTSNTSLLLQNLPPLSERPASASCSTIEMEVTTVPAIDEPNPELILLSDKFKMDLLVMERAVLANIFQPKLAAYRHLPVLKDCWTSVTAADCCPDPDVQQLQLADEVKTESLSPFLECLWTFRCDITAGRNISCMAWNKKNPDLLAVGYGPLDSNDKKPALVCCWSIKNPVWPERILHCQSDVTALDFCASSPSQLAVGMCDGTIAVYDMKSAEATHVSDSSNSPHKHTGPVWELKWINQEKGPSGDDRGETLVSASSDGRITKWSLQKGLECVDLMKLKKTKARGEFSLISRQVPGLSFDFHPSDSSIYLAATEEGNIHKCSCFYSEQFQETYGGHNGPVYKVTWSPFSPDVFLSCSSDWTIQLWRQDLMTPVLGFTSTQSAVHDIMWSPKWPTVFGAVKERRVEIWDLRASILDPTIVNEAKPGVTLTRLLFATQTDCVLVGDSDGGVSVYRLKSLTMDEGAEHVKALQDVIVSTLASQL